MLGSVKSVVIGGAGSLLSDPSPPADVSSAGSPTTETAAAAPDPVTSVLLLTAAGLVVLYVGGLFVTDWLLTLAGPFTSLLLVGAVGLWIRGYV